MESEVMVAQYALPAARRYTNWQAMPTLPPALPPAPSPPPATPRPSPAPLLQVLAWLLLGAVLLPLIGIAALLERWLPQRLRTLRQRLWAELTSMRFAVALLPFIGLAALLGTLLPQREPAEHYLHSWGPFWAPLLMRLQWHDVYGAWWFMGLLGLLLLSTGACVLRNARPYLAAIGDYRLPQGPQALRSMPWSAQALCAGQPDALAQRMRAGLRQRGWQVQVQQRPAQPHPHQASAPAGTGWLLAAKQGAAGHRLGYLATHCAIVLICLGALQDSSLALRARAWWQGQSPWPGPVGLQPGQLQAIAGQHRLSAAGHAFRGHLRLAQGERSALALLEGQTAGHFVQQLPFAIELEHFEIARHASGQPSMFSSQVRIHQPGGAASSQHRIAVNQPLRLQGIDIYQTGFEEHRSELRLRPLGLQQPVPAATLSAHSGSTLALPAWPGLAGYRLEQLRLHTGLEDDPPPQTPPGPAIQYRLRNAAGQAIEGHNTMQAIELDDGVPAYLLGVRRAPGQPFAFLRLPQDELGRIDSMLGLLHGLRDPEQRQRAVQRHAQHSLPQASAQARAELQHSASHLLALFAGQAAGGAGEAIGTASPAGLAALAQLVQRQAGAAQQEAASQGLLQLLSQLLLSMLQQQRQDAGLPPMPPGTPYTDAFLRSAMLALDAAQDYPAPLFFMLEDFTPRYASILQVSQAPGRSLVYTGCLLLVLGLGLLLFVQERRLWVWLQAAPAGRSQATLGLSCQRAGPRTAQGFAQLRRLLLQPPAGPTTTEPQ
ncbi:cytochrome C biogenesis protein ResB [Vandammella animalimorsus]|uniref:Cytochrome C biogenesis protein ResB n=2 Tax=Vandammella animalimorsus TaxID=2029117 RepID=A0A2A2ARU6_9BURK|nr:cytochrome C biogenesis protein ResB [Vandammella animalimorsus]